MKVKVSIYSKILEKRHNLRLSLDCLNFCDELCGYLTSWGQADEDESSDLLDGKKQY